MSNEKTTNKLAKEEKVEKVKEPEKEEKSTKNKKAEEVSTKETVIEEKDTKTTKTKDEKVTEAEKVTEMEAEIDELPVTKKDSEKAYDVKNSNMVAGIIGAFIGSLVGLILWVIIYRLGYIAGIAGFVITIGAFKGYEKLGKNLDKPGVIVTTIIIIIMVWLSNKVACTLSAYEALKDYYTFTECFINLNRLLEASDLTRSYYSDLAVGYFLTILCSYKTIADAFKNNKN